MFHVEPADSKFQTPRALSGLIEQHYDNAAKLAAALEISVGTMTNLMNRQAPQRISEKTLSKLIRLDKPTPAEIGGVILAHLHDELVRAGIEPTRYFLRHVDGVDIDQLKLATASNVELGIVARAAERDPAVAEVISNLARRILDYEAAVSDAKAEANAVKTTAA